MINLLGHNLAQLGDLIETMGEKRFRARQIFRWIHQNGVADVDKMTDVSMAFRAQLVEIANVLTPAVIADHVSQDGCRKLLIDVTNGNAVETVFIPEESRGTLCISSQAGCALECAFCSTGHQGFNRNLEAHEIVGQFWIAKCLLNDFGSDNERRISNVVFMGMGEPLANYQNTLTALQVLLDDHAYGLSRRRITVSTAGIVPAIYRLADECPVALAVSLHAPTDDLRDRLVPINRKYPLATLMEACRYYLQRAPRDYVTFEYVMLDGINDTDAHADALLECVESVKCKINLIPFNGFPGSPFRTTPAARVCAFSSILRDGGLVVTTRKVRGDDIDAACGQLAGQVIDRRGSAFSRASRLIPSAVRTVRVAL